MQPWIDWKKVTEYSKMPPTQRLTVLYSLIILTLAGMLFKSRVDGGNCQHAQVVAEQEKAQIRRECDSTKFALSQQFEKEKQAFYTDRISQLEKKEKFLDSAIAVFNQTRQINERTLRNYAK